MKRYLSRIALWLALWLPWLYVGVFAYTAGELYFSFSSATGGGSGHTEQREYGWPYEWRESSQDADGGTYYDLRYFSIAMLAVDFMASLVISVLLFVILRKWWQAIRTRGFRFRVSTLLLLMVVVSLPLAGWRHLENQYRHEANISRELDELAVLVVRGDPPLLVMRLEQILPDRARRIWQRADEAWFGTLESDRNLDEICKLLKQLSHLHILSMENLDSFDKPDDILPIVLRLNGITEINLAYSGVTDRGIEYLKTCQQLTKIDIRETQVSADAVRQLRAALPDTEIIYDEEETSE